MRGVALPRQSGHTRSVDLGRRVSLLGKVEAI